eukprot:TRINITY_DN1454_c1_g1_i1.p1 TRINITY_DN1454_c1_g1~~TRINITY_DN1454_c1_g1_i1.p1  ORF type:complete len:330 (-),score=107.72 TRINITY_DN1454_c1_g1_i1:85-1074(-)
MAAPAPAAESSDAKTELNHFCQRFCQRPVTKQDIVYSTNKFGNQYQAIVKLNCIQGQEYAGHLCLSQKDAEKSAADQAAKVYASQLATLPPPASKDPAKKKAKVPLTAAELAEKKAKQLDEGDNPAITPKTKLNTLIMKIAKRYLQKGETVYECTKYAGGYQATVKFTALPGEWGTRVWAGHVLPTKQKAEQSAAEIALAQIAEDKELQEEAAKPKGAGKGKGKGKGKGWDFMMGPWGWGYMWGGKPGGPNLPRTKVQDEVAGEVIEWKGKFGWVKPDVDVDHPAAKRRDGKIYVSQKDVSGDMAAGARVTFSIYEDESGLGAQDVKTL